MALDWQGFQRLVKHFAQLFLKFFAVRFNEQKRLYDCDLLLKKILFCPKNWALPFKKIFLCPSPARTQTQDPLIKSQLLRFN